MNQLCNMENQLRKIEGDEQPDLHHVDVHWKQMQTMLQPVSVPVKKRMYSKILMGGVISGLFILVGAIYLLQDKKPIEFNDNNAFKKAPPIIYNNATAAVTDMKTVAKKPAVTKNNFAPHNYFKPIAIYDAGLFAANPVAGENVITANIPNNAINAVAGNDEKDKQLLLQFFTEIEKPAQEFVVDNTKDINLACKEGTRVFIPANSFVNSSNVAVSRDILIAVKEFYSYGDIVSNKLNTTSNGLQLISGGMLYIEASQDGKELKLAATKKMTIKIPVTEYDDQMQLFVNERQPTENASATADFAYDYSDHAAHINWQPAGQFQHLERNKFYIKAFDPYGEPYEVETAKDGTTTARFVIRKNCPMSNEEVLKGLKGHFGLFYDRIKLKRSWGNHPSPLFATRDWPVVGDSVMIEYNVAKQLNLVSKADMEKYEQQLLAENIKWDEKMKSIPFYEFQLSKLGFMNCDRFQNNTDPKVEFTLNLGEGENAANFFSVLTFDKYKSVMPGLVANNKLQFSKIPENANVHLICVGVKNGKILSCIKSMKTGREEVSGLEFTETTPQEFKNQIASLHLK